MNTKLHHNFAHRPVIDYGVQDRLAALAASRPCPRRASSRLSHVVGLLKPQGNHRDVELQFGARGWGVVLVNYENMLHQKEEQCLKV